MARPNPRPVWLSAIVVEGGLVRGYVVTDRREDPELILEIDGKEVARVRARLPTGPVPHPGAAPRRGKARGFAFPLHEAYLRGMPHEVVVRVADTPRGRRVESRLKFQKGDRYGTVARADGHYTGWVAFSREPESLPELEISNGAGDLCMTVKLIAVPARDNQSMPFVASFRIPEQSVRAAEPRFRCAGVELHGSPCARARNLVGLLESATAETLRGWALDLNQPGSPLELVLRVDGHSATHFRPNVRRLDLARHLKLPEEGFGIAGFQLVTPGILLDGERHRIDIEFAPEGIPLRGSGQYVRFARPYLSFPEVAPVPKTPSRARVAPLPSSPTVSVIVLNRDGETPLAALLESWERHNRVPGVEWVVVDHASQDGSLALLERWRSRLPVRIIPLQSNDSFSASSNRAAAAARGKYLLFLNNDIVWLQDALAGMLQTLERDRGVGVVGLKLLKTADDGNLLAQPQVQHLGIRIKLSGGAYQPYEAVQHARETEYGPQKVPAVTGAAMLCRKSDLVAAGGFDPGYFYGFEDVEFCLRLAERLGKTVVCRNDLVALHRHGHTRLSGRATDIFERQAHNADVLQDQVGLWLKRAYWQSLLAADGGLTMDELTVGFVVDGGDTGERRSPLLEQAVVLARHLLSRQPAARPVFLAPERGWYDVRGIHVLVVGHPEYDIRGLDHRRADLLTLAWIRDQSEYWARMPWWDEFDAYLAGTAKLARRLAPKTACPVACPTPRAPLGRILDPGAPPMRVAILVPSSRDESDGTPLLRKAQRLRRALRAEGALAWVVTREGWSNPTRLADIRVILDHRKIPSDLELKSVPGNINVLWQERDSGKTPPEGFLRTTAMPEAGWLRRQMEKRLGRTFRTP